MKLHSILACAALIAGSVFAATPVRAAPVDLALSLVIDVSGSVSTAEYNLQMDGYANALRDPTIQANMLNGSHGNTAMNVVFFASNFIVTALDGFAVLASGAQINAFANLLDGFARPGSGGTTVHAGTNRAIDLLLAAIAVNGLLEGTSELVIDVSGDGTSSAALSQAARDRAASHQMTINGLPIGGAAITQFYANNVITANGFVVPASGFDDFSDAVRRKLLIETGGTVPEPASLGLVLTALALVAARGQGRRRLSVAPALRRAA